MSIILVVFIKSPLVGLGSELVHVLVRRTLEARGLSVFRLFEDAIRGPKIIKLLLDLVFLRFCFEFETIHGKGIVVAFLVPTPDDTWTTCQWSLLTRLQALQAFSEKASGPSRDYTPFSDRRLACAPLGSKPRGLVGGHRREIDFAGGDPTVLIIGAGSRRWQG